MMNAFDWL